MIAKSLHQTGYEVDVCNDGEEALDMIYAEMYDLIVKIKSNKNIFVRFRGWIQAAATLLTNIHIPNLWKGKIYQGNVKTMCVPGLNCYSCPAGKFRQRKEPDRL